MSGCFRSNLVNDKEALLWLLSNSTVYVLSNESANAIVLLLKINKSHIKRENPYIRLYFLQNKIVQESIIEMVIKLTPLSNTNQTEKILVENQIIHVTTHEGWQNEVHLQKYVFYHTYMIDMQMQAVCPNILCSWKILPSQINAFLGMLTIANSSNPIKRKFKQWDYGEVKERLAINKNWIEKPTTHLQTIIQFFKQIYENRLTVGCMLMEYLRDVKDMVEYPCVQMEINERKDPGSMDEYKEYLYGKAYGIIQYDKCRAIGIEHDDLHWGNMITYRTPTNELASAVIDFGIAHKTTVLWKSRPRPFYKTCEIYDNYEICPPYQRHVHKKRSYLDGLIQSNESLRGWNDVTRKIGSQSKRYDYVPVNEMNDIDKEMIHRGHIIYNYLREETKQDVDLWSHYLTHNQLNEGCISLLDPETPQCIALFTKRQQKSYKSAHRFRHKK
jgi:hypothetical protein